MQSYVIRQPRENEGPVVGRVQNTAWEQAYTGLLPARFWNAEALAQREQMWTRGFTTEAGREQVRVAEHREAGRFYSIGQEYPRTLNKAREILKRETAHIEFQPWRDDNWSRVLPHLRNDSFPKIE